MMSDSVVPLRTSGRQLQSWIAGFLEQTDTLTSPEIFRRWAAISAIAGALERKVWIYSQKQYLYPNIYAFLCAPPGIGKSNAFHAVQQYWLTLTDHHLAPVDLTKAAFVDQLAQSPRAFEPLNTTFHALLVGVGELGALLPGYDAAFMNLLTYLYDGQKFEERRRGKGDNQISIPAPCVNILACTTPGFLNNMLPAGAWDQGFMARVIIVFSGQEIKQEVNLMDEEPKIDLALDRALKLDLQKIGSFYGQMKFTKQTNDAINEWYQADDDKPTHPRLQHYATRRLAHLLKLCMIAAVDRGVTHIDLYEFNTARNWLTEVESVMPDVFKAMVSGGEPAVMNECLHYMMSHWVKQGNGVLETEIFAYLAQRLPAHSVERVLENMKKSGMIVAVKGGWAPTQAVTSL